MAVFCNPDTLSTIRRPESAREHLESQGYVLVCGDDPIPPAEKTEAVKAPKPAKAPKATKA